MEITPYFIICFSLKVGDLAVIQAIKLDHVKHLMLLSAEALFNLLCH